MKAVNNFFARLDSTEKWIITIVGICMSLFHLYTAGVMQMTPWLQRSYHLLFALILVFLYFPITTREDLRYLKIIDYLLVILSLTSILYIPLYMDDLISRAGMWDWHDAMRGGVLILLVLEATRRVCGKALPIIAGVFLLYALYGNHLPGLLAHRGYDLQRLFTQQYLTLEGIFGTPLGVSATYVFVFILFGAFLQKSGAGQFFIDMAFALTGRSRGGPAKTAVIASGLMGSISGSAVANVATTGPFTINLMKKVGYRPHFAGAVEAAASSGGQFMPPIMGASAFIIAEFLGIQYVMVIAAAAIPAVLYFLSIFASVHFEAERLGLRILKKDEIPDWKVVLKEGFYFLTPLLLLIYLLAVTRVTPTRTAFWVILTTMALSWIRSHQRMGPREFFQALELGAKNALTVVTACACAGLVIGVITLTGIGLQLSTLVIALSGGIMILALLFGMLGSIILGMGLPTTAAYIIMATLGAPALVEIGVQPVAAHLFVFYFAIISAITPPIALAAYTGGAIAGADVNRTAFTALKVALAGFFIPFMFVYNPELLLYGETAQVVIGALTAAVGVVVLSAATIGYMKVRLKLWERGMLFLSALFLMYSGIFNDLIGLGLIAFVIVTKFFINKEKLDIPVTSRKSD